MLKEAKAESDAESAEDSADHVQDLVTDLDETLMSSERTSAENPDASNAGGGAQGEAHTADEQESELRSIDRDRWLIEGDYLVRKHAVPRTTLSSPLDVPDDPPPIDVKSIEVLRITKPIFSGGTWPEMNTVEDCWMGRAHDAKSLLDPSNGSTLTWTGETIFQRVYPKAPKGKAWCNGELIRTRRGSKRTPDIHPLHWWLMSEKGRLLAQDEWKVKLGEILQAQNRRSIPRVELDKIPPGIQPSASQSGVPAMPSLFLRSDG